MSPLIQGAPLQLVRSGRLHLEIVCRLPRWRVQRRVRRPGRLVQVAHVVAVDRAGPVVGEPGRYGHAPGGDGLFVSVHDDGCGFDPATTPEGVGLSRSLRGRIAEVGGRVELTSSPGNGTEVRIHLGGR